MFSERGGHHIWSSSTSSQFSARGSWLLLAGHSSQLFSGGSSQFCNSNLRPSSKSPQRSPPEVRAHCDPGASSGKGLGRTTPQGGPFEGDWGAERPRGMPWGGFRALCAPEGAWGGLGRSTPQGTCWGWAWGAPRPRDVTGVSVPGALSQESPWGGFEAPVGVRRGGFFGVGLRPRGPLRDGLALHPSGILEGGPGAL